MNIDFSKQLNERSSPAFLCTLCIEICYIYIQNYINIYNYISVHNYINIYNYIYRHNYINIYKIISLYKSVYWILERLTNRIMIMSRDLTFYFLKLTRKCVIYSIFLTNIYSFFFMEIHTKIIYTQRI